ncbi:MAG: sugar ABC transporter ATP-binding protein, partial [Chloroflexota bacterium]
TNMDEVIRQMVGTDLKQLYPKRSIPVGEVVLDARGVTPAGAAQGVSFTVRRGEIVGIYGLVGAGKTEVARAIFGVDRRAKGEILLDGKAVKIRSRRDAIREGIALIPEERRSQGLLPTHGIHQNISLACLHVFERMGLVRGGRELGVAQQRIQEIRIVTPGAKTQVQYLSGGNQQKVVVGKWLTTSARVYMLDEPTAGIDVGAKAEIYKLVEDLAEEGAGILLISSELEEVLGIADRVLVMRDGEIVFETTPSQTTPDEVLAHSLGAVRTRTAESASLPSAS